MSTSSSVTDGSGDFKLVKHKNRFKKRISSVNVLSSSSVNSVLSDSEKESILRRVEKAKLDISSSDLYASAKASLREGLDVLNNPVIKEIICFGLGKIGESTISRYQLALLLCLRDLYSVPLVVYDPVFSELEHYILQSLNCKILTTNLEGKYKIKDKTTTIFYLPHCSNQLTNNLLWCNWGLNLHSCIIISNSFTKIIENTSKSLKDTYNYIFKISPYVLELAVINTFMYYEIFNDTAIHIFPWKSISLIANDFWIVNCEPVYKQNIEFITKNLESGLSINS